MAKYYDIKECKDLKVTFKQDNEFSKIAQELCKNHARMIEYEILKDIILIYEGVWKDYDDYKRFIINKEQLRNKTAKTVINSVEASLELPYISCYMMNEDQFNYIRKLSEYYGKEIRTE